MRWQYLSPLKLYRVGLAALLFLSGCVPASEPKVESRLASPPAVTGDCSQVRKTPSAPLSIRKRNNPISLADENFQVGQKLYENAKPLACKLCHGELGDGKGDPDFESTPPARNFTCASTMNALSDGQLFWIIKNGSPNTSMPAFADLSEENAWQLVRYLREFSKSK